MQNYEANDFIFINPKFSVNSPGGCSLVVRYTPDAPPRNNIHSIFLVPHDVPYMKWIINIIDRCTAGVNLPPLRIYV